MTDMEKKVTKPRKPRATAAKPAELLTAATKTAEPKATATKKSSAKSNVTQMKASHDEIAKLAHRYWLERGRQDGHDAEDWLRAEQKLRGMAS